MGVGNQFSPLPSRQILLRPRASHCHSKDQLETERPSPWMLCLGQSGKASVCPSGLASPNMCSNPQTSASSGSQAGPHKGKGGRDSPASGGSCRGGVLHALQGEQLSSFIHTKSRFLPFGTALLFQEDILRGQPAAGWSVCLPRSLGHSFVLGLHPGLQDTVSSTNVGDIMAFSAWKLIDSFLMRA